MKNYALLAAAALGLLAACSKNEAVPQQPGTDPDNGEVVLPPTPDPMDDGTPVPLQFGLGSPAALTKSTGTVGDVNGGNNVWNGQTLYVLGFDRTIADFTNAESDAFIWNVAATAPTGAASGVIDVLNDDPDGDGTPNPGQEEPFYYNGNTVYDFYGYHIDDAATDEIQSEATRVFIPFTITGGQDIMVAKADPAADIDGTEVTDARYAYSAYAARRGVQPELVFEHQLSRFTFEVVPGSASADNIQVESIELQSRTTGNLVVVGTDLGVADVEETLAWLPLQQRSAEGALEALEPVSPADWNDAVDAEQTSTPVGESIIAIPGVESYQLRVVLADETGTVTTPIEDQEYTLSAADITGGNGADTFEAGKSYKITIVVYGLERVVITATLQPWEDGGSTVIDPDQPPVE